VKHFAALFFVVRKWNLVRFFVALVLLVAASLKAYQLVTEPVLGDGLFHARWFNILVVEFEIFFGFWLITNLLPSLTWFASIFIFSIFTLVSLFKAVTGETSCGCFGNVMVNPWLTAAFDIGVVALLVCVRPTTINRFSIKWLKVLSLVWLVVAVSAAWFMTSQKTEDFGDIGVQYVTFDGKNTVLLTPSKWVGKELPVLPLLKPRDIRDILKDGEWTIVFFNHDCEKCQQLLIDMKTKQAPNVILIEIPPYGEPAAYFQYCRLDGSRKWVVDTPLVIRLKDLIVTDVNE
jgi:hypothetical protein